MDKMATSGRPAGPGPQVEDGHDELRAQVRATFERAIASGSPLFRTSAPGLWATYLDAIAPELRQSMNCGACRKFIERYGSLVTIDDKGRTTSAIWPEVAGPNFAEVSRRLARAVEAAEVTGVFLSQRAVLGKPLTGEWMHFSLNLPGARLWTSLVKTASQAMADKREERDMLERGLDEFPIAAVRKAHSYLKSGALFRSEKCEGVAAWLLDLHERCNASKNTTRRKNLLWQAAATAPAGYCHVRAGMIGTLLEDIVAELPFATLKARFDAKMHPLQYQRPQAAPTAGNIAQAEKIVAAMQSAGSLARRFAKLVDVQCLWQPRAAASSPKEGGVFSHLLGLRTEDAPENDAPPTVMTWVKFAATVLPEAEAIDFWVPSGKEPYMAMVTAQNPDAPPILQWDSETRRNRVSWYLYVNGSTPQDWNLKPSTFHRVSAVVLQPTLWDETRSFSHQGASVCLVLAGARDLTYRQGAGFFVESLRSEYHPIRATLEAYVKGAVIAGKDEAEVCGIRLNKGSTWNQIVRVTAQGVRTRYQLDRWD